MNVQEKPIFIWKVVHQDSFETEAQGNSEMTYSIFESSAMQHNLKIPFYNELSHGTDGTRKSSFDLNYHQWTNDKHSSWVYLRINYTLYLSGRAVWKMALIIEANLYGVILSIFFITIIKSLNWRLQFVSHSWRVPARLDGISLFVLLGVQPVNKPVESS